MNSDFNDFLKHTVSQKEVSLIIAKDDAQLGQFKNQLVNDFYFKEATHVSHLLNYTDSSIKIFFILSGELSKDIYDFIVQYPTGQIEIFDQNSAKWSVAKPKYQDAAIVFLLTKEDLDKIQKQGFQLLENVGLTYQT